MQRACARQPGLFNVKHRLSDSVGCVRMLQGEDSGAGRAPRLSYSAAVALPPAAVLVHTAAYPSGRYAWRCCV